MHINRLAREKSPYLLQHAHNPVDWYPWGDDAFSKAKAEDKPIFLSIGYSTCHWCHVMERESFELESVAEVLNRHFVPVKVDREERPDVDRVYMTFVQATTGGGGWPMSVWLTPEGKPFYGGTYFPPDNRFGRPGFRALLEHIAGVWSADRSKVIESGDDIVRQLSQMVTEKTPAGKAERGALDTCFFACRRSFDTTHGGFGGAPKFPRPVQLNFLHRYSAYANNEEAAGMSLITLEEMFRGGMYDQLGGGFHRYSVDAHWFVPHFEKMLYDQAQLAIAYLEGYQISGKALFAQVARETFDYVLRDMTDSGGGFYSAEDADSVIDPAEPKHKGEGAFYVWSQQELDEVIGRPAGEWFAYRFGVEPSGNVHEDPHAEFTGRNILYQAHTVEETAKHYAVSTAEVERAIADASQRLMARRSTRVRPHLDDKVLTAWNGLMISAFAKGAQVLGEPRYQHAAERAVDFVLDEMMRDGVLLRRYRDGETAIAGFLDDYAFFVQGLLDLYETSFDLRLLDRALELTHVMLDRFEDKTAGAFFSTAEGDESLVLRIKDDYDGAEPSGNSVAVMNLLRLARLTQQDRLRAASEKALDAFAGRINTTPLTVPQMLAAFLYHIATPGQIVIVGDRQSADTKAMLAAVRARFLPGATTLLVDSGDARQRLGAWLPMVKEMKAVDGKATAYVCENYTCRLPVTDLDELIKLLE